MPTGPRQPGEFCWFNLLTADPEAAKTFFSGVLGWTYGEIPGMGWLIKVGGQDVGGLFDLYGPGTPPGLPPAITVMIQAASADATAETVRASGGRAAPPFDVMQNGRMAVCHDPAGAAFDLWQPLAQPGTTVDSRATGAPSWFELLTTDVEGARTFYRQVFGWASETMPMPGLDYTVFRRGNEPLAGMMAITPAIGGIPPCWCTYFTVEAVDRTVAEAVRAGGTVVVPAEDVPGVGRFAGLLSPQQVFFFVITYAG